MKFKGGNQLKNLKKMHTHWNVKRQVFYSFFVLPLLSKSAIGLYYFIAENIHSEIFDLVQNVNFKTFVFTLIIVCIFELMQLPAAP